MEHGHSENYRIREKEPLLYEHTMAPHPHYGEVDNINHEIRKGDGEYQIVIETTDGKKFTCENVTFVWGGAQEGLGRAVCVGTDTKTEERIFVPCPPGTEIYKIKKHKQRPKYYD